MKSLWIPLAGLLLVASASPAGADVAPDPCDGKQSGDACTTYDNKPGTCVDNPSAPGTLTCQETVATTTSGTTGAGGAGGSASGAGGSSPSGSSGDDSGCSVHPGAASGAAGVWLLLAASALLRRRRRG